LPHGVVGPDIDVTFPREHARSRCKSLRRRRSPARRWTLAGAAALGSVLTLALSPPLERVIASLTPWSISPLVLSTAPAVAVVLIPARIVLYAKRADR
jgi:hypothetical protein